MSERCEIVLALVGCALCVVGLVLVVEQEWFASSFVWCLAAILGNIRLLPDETE